MNYSRKDILDKKFKANVKGYDANEVDSYLDQIIQDYGEYEEKLINKDNTIVNLRNKYAELSGLGKENESLRIENLRLQNRLNGIKSGDRPNKENLELIKKVNALESYIKYLGYSDKDFKEYMANKGQKD